jgi:3-methyl-2-oxobutanoate hydroxymethyltransferase
MIRSRINIDAIQEKKVKGEKIVMLTAYDYASAEVAEEAGVDIILVGDSLGVTVLGYNSTREVTMDDMVHHLKAVERGAVRSFVVCDLPINSYWTCDEAVKNSVRLMETGCHSVKIEGCMTDIVECLVRHKVPVMGHVGLTPQTIKDFKVQGKAEKDADRLKEEARKLENAGCFAIVLECIPVGLAKCITKNLSIPTIGIGAGSYCDGQVLVYNDLLGIFNKFKPKFVRRYKDLRNEMVQGCRNYAADVRAGKYPETGESYK